MSEHPTEPRENRPDDPMDEAMNENEQRQHAQQRQDDTAFIGGDPTRAIPEPQPFRVEPSTPVPDDVVAAQATAGPPAPDPATRRPDPEPYRPPLVTVRKGPRPGTVMLGLLAVVVAAYVLITNLTGAQVDIARMGPSLLGGVGVLLLLIGLTGVLLGRRR
ncbi:MAG: hypothetical protein ACTHJJ_15455 [Intrasporangium sp.]|uniref:hypothetical protein n=1 Tax=Intrasporangium sp. TaxID=1925024 RepID=UPI003F7FD34C